MNKDLDEIIKIYSTKTKKELLSYLSNLSKTNLTTILIDIITLYMNDKNSSTLREYLTVILAGYKHINDKIGYNGYKQSVFKKPIKCEVKPQNIQKKGSRKLDGRGNFTDYTWDRLYRDMKENPNLLISGFIDGKLIYIIEFPFRCESFLSKIKNQLKKRFPNGDIKGQYLRSASFNYKDFIKCKNLKIIYCIKKSELRKYEKNIVRDFYKFLMSVAPDD